MFGSIDFTPPTSDDRPGVQPDVQRQLEPVRIRRASRTPSCPSHSGERANWNARRCRAGTRATSASACSVETSVGVNGRQRLRRRRSSICRTERARQLDVRGRNAERADGGVRRQPGDEHERNADERAVHERALLVQREQQAPHQVHDRAAPRLSTRRISRPISSAPSSYNSLADLDAGHPAVFTRQLSPRTRSDGEYVGGALARRLVPSDPTIFRCSTACASTATASRPSRVSTPTSSGCSASRNDHVPNKALPEPAHRLLVDVRTGAADRRLRRRVRGPRAVRARRHRHVPEHAERVDDRPAMDNTGLRRGVQQLVCVGSAAPTPDWAAYTANLGAIPTQCAERHDGHRVRQHARRTSRCSTRTTRRRVRFARTSTGRARCSTTASV